MKVKKMGADSFEPVNIQITLETEAELNEFYCVFTHTFITDILLFVDAAKIRCALNLAPNDYESTFKTFEKRILEKVLAKA